MKRIQYKMVYLTILILLIVGCGHRQTEYDIKIVIPAGNSEEFVYSHEEISPIKDKIILSNGEGLSDTEVLLKTVQVKEKTEYEPSYLTPGLPVEMDVEKGAWFKVGINMQNPTEEDITVYVTIKNIEVRIE